MKNKLERKDAKYDFYEKVRVSSADAEAREVNGALGAVLGRAQDNSGKWSYAVYIYQTGIVWSFSKDELLSQGEFDVEETFHDGTSIRVQVDKEGRGTIVE